MSLNPNADAESFIKSLDNEPLLQMAILEVAEALGGMAEARKGADKLRLTLAHSDAELLCRLIGDMVLSGPERLRMLKIYRVLLRAGIIDALLKEEE